MTRSLASVTCWMMNMPDDEGHIPSHKERSRSRADIPRLPIGMKRCPRCYGGGKIAVVSKQWPKHQYDLEPCPAKCQDGLVMDHEVRSPAAKKSGNHSLFQERAI